MPLQTDSAGCDDRAVGGGDDSSEDWRELRTQLHVGQRLTGRVFWVSSPGVIGVGVDLGLAVKGFVDVLMLPYDAAQWPTLDTVTEFEIIDIDERPQIRLRPVEPSYRADHP